MKTPATNLVVALGLGAAGIAVAAAGIYVGETDDAPGAALLGLLLMLGLITLAGRTARRKSPLTSGADMKRQDYLTVVLAPIPVLVIPLLGNMFVEGWNWNPGAFVLLWVVLAVATLIYKLIATSPGAALAHRLAAGLAVLAGFLIFWMTIGPKIIGEENPGNLLYLLAILLGLIGVGFSRLQPARLAKVAFGMAAALLLIPVVAVLLWPSNFGHGYPKVQLLSSVFAAVFVTSGLLFRRAAPQPTPADRTLGKV